MASDDRAEGAPKAVRRENGAIMCSCGDRLADRIDGDSVVIDGTEFQFRRRNDHMTCRQCGASLPMREFREGRDAPRDTGHRRRASDR